VVWSPPSQRRRHIALRPAPQASYERATALSLSITPVPMSSRVFILSKASGCVVRIPLVIAGVAERSMKDVALRRDVVGFNGQAGGLMNDDLLFWVLEWSGMEVMHTSLISSILCLS
jgi:hypothetical protein